jgi:hypothetical protein
MAAAIFCSGSAYVAQQCYTSRRHSLGIALQLLALFAACVSFWCLLAAVEAG